MDEFELIRTWFARSSGAGDVIVGVGDDAAVLAPSPDHHLVMTTDTLVAGRHFPEDFSAFDIGWRSLAVNLSDLAAMGAVPRWCLLSLCLPRADADWLNGFAEGFFALAGEYGIELVGGDTVQGPLSITVQATGEVPVGEALRRSGARAGDRVCIGGVPGEAAAGLQAWCQGQRKGPAVTAFRQPQPQVGLGRALRGVASACIDVSDGLLADLSHILTASAVGAELQLPSLPVTAAFDGCDRAQRLRWQLAGGDDYLLLFTLPSSAPMPDKAVLLGEVTGEAGLRLRDEQGKLVDYPVSGFNHFPEGAG